VKLKAFLELYGCQRSDEALYFFQPRMAILICAGHVERMGKVDVNTGF
jgi:hypothetical protein